MGFAVSIENNLLAHSFKTKYEKSWVSHKISEGIVIIFHFPETEWKTGKIKYKFPKILNENSTLNDLEIAPLEVIFISFIFLLISFNFYFIVFFFCVFRFLRNFCSFANFHKLIHKLLYFVLLFYLQVLKPKNILRVNKSEYKKYNFKWVEYEYILKYGTKYLEFIQSFCCEKNRFFLFRTSFKLFLTIIKIWFTILTIYFTPYGFIIFNKSFFLFSISNNFRKKSEFLELKFLAIKIKSHQNFQANGPKYLSNFSLKNRSINLLTNRQEVKKFRRKCNKENWKRIQRTRISPEGFAKTMMTPFRYKGHFPAFFLLLSALILGVGGACPRLCVCKWKGGKQTVECVNKGLTTIPEQMDPGTQVLDLTGNPLVIISREKFKTIRLTNLQRIYATRCKLVQLDDTAFKSLSNLVELDLSENELRMVPAAALQYLPSLMRLQLSYNPITHIKDGSFRSLGFLTSLELSGCAIKSLEPLAFQGLDRLEWLKIDNNSLTTVPDNMMLPKSLHGVDIHNNPWRCDCKLQELRDWLVQYNVPSSIEPKCHGPIRLRNRVIKYVEKNELACSPEIRPSSLFLDVVEGKNVSFECHVTATPEAVISWQFNGHPLENSTFVYDETTSMFVFEEKGDNEDIISNLRIEAVAEAHTGIFQCVAENRAGKIISNFTLRVSLPPSEPTPEVDVMDHVIYIGVALVSLVVLVIILICILIVRCCKKRVTSTRSKSTTVMNVSKLPREKQLNNRPKSNNMPQYVQMGTSAPKVNGILAETSPISVIENSPYRNEPLGSTHINPDLIADSPDDRVKPKKKVSILGVEEVDESGNRYTRKLDDILEENEENLDKNCDKIGNENICLNNGHPTPQYQSIMKNTSSQNNSYIQGTIHPTEVPQMTARYYEKGRFPNDYGLPHERSWINNSDIEIPKNFSPVPSETSSIYSTIRRNPIGSLTNIANDQTIPEEYSLCETNSQFPTTNGRFSQSYMSTSEMCEKGHSYCDCCQAVVSQSVQGEFPLSGSIERMRGDGCSFDNLLTSCSGGNQCCYNENSNCHHHTFDSSLVETYRSIETSPPPPPAGYGDSEDEDAAQTKEWCEGNLSPGTRVLYSPEEAFNDMLIEPNGTKSGIPNI